MMTLTPCTPPEAPLGLFALPLVLLPLAAPACCCCGDLGFLFSAGTEHSTDAALMRLAV
jgi:hypothetical protein